VAAGKVIYSGRLPGYGTLLIVDHGDRTHTLYARLSDIAVEQGTIVNAGDELAATAPLDSRERNFYFEIRVRGKPVNPAGFLR
jgi:septal ring factor EnvC (AmiA/AmiB activator)